MSEAAADAPPDRRRRWLGLSWSVLLAGAVAFPWFFDRGFLLLLDFAWTPTLPTPAASWETARHLLPAQPYQWFFWWLSQFLATDLVQKAAFTLPFFLASLSAFQLAAWILRRHGEPARAVGALAGATFYALNPFVVTRAFMGQYYLLLAYALTPWALLALLRLLSDPSPRRGFTAAASFLIVMITNAHHLLLLPLLALPFLPRLLRRTHGHRGALWAFLAPLIIGVTVVVAVAAPAGGTSVAGLHPLGPWARTLRAPFSGNLPVDVLTLTANWKLDLPFTSLSGASALFAPLAAIVLAVCAVGFASLWQRRHPDLPLIPLLVLLFLAGGLAIGVAHPLTEPLAAALYRHVPFWLALRDSGKLVSLVALIETVLLAAGVGYLLERGSRASRSAAAAVLAAILLLAAPSFAGFGGQITPLAYPKSWTARNDALGRLGPRPVVLFLPWHQYLGFRFTNGRTIANPAEQFFTQATVIAGDNSEVGGTDGRPFIASESTRPISQAIEELLRDAEHHSDFGQRVAALGIDTIALADDAFDAERYSFLHQQADLVPVFTGDQLTVWRVVLPKSE